MYRRMTFLDAAGCSIEAALRGQGTMRCVIGATARVHSFTSKQLASGEKSCLARLFSRGAAARLTAAGTATVFAAAHSEGRGGVHEGQCSC